MSRGKRRQWPKLREGQRLHLEDLNADCILEIIWCLRNFDATRKKGQFSGVVALSMCSKKLRAVVGSLMRREVVLSHKLPAGGLLPSCRYPLDALRVVEYILESVEEAEKTTPTLKLAIVFNTSWGRQPNVVESIQKALCGTLRSFKTLETLEIELAPRSWLRDCLELAMRDSPFEMPTVKTLSLGPGCGFMFPVCPKVETVAVAGSLEHYGRKICSQHVYEAITAAAKCPNLEGFKVTQWWSLTTMEEIHRQLPGLKLLVLGTRYREIEAMQEMTREVSAIPANAKIAAQERQ
ncbi:hypothetical protein K490DRAFT_64511 [Saccharata proteae CBS 121410]|uniref:Uncharacterized protein n=1 Tax=Saccharata proteae CBS 121410 TaxID=1314787 RepID=A0A9P4I082_9PEZI|nr:hypothetical protein K490DRAFT_64511 [Saccharata proteae CBS 121410]